MTPFQPPAPPANAPRFSARPLVPQSGPTREQVAIVAQCARDLIRAAEPTQPHWAKAPLRSAGWGEILARAIAAGVPVALADRALEWLVYESGEFLEPVLATVAEVPR